MGYSPLTDKIMSTSKRSSRYGQAVRQVIVHHWAGTGGGVQRLVHSSDQASANYIILNDGTLIGSVDEKYRAWTSGSGSADRPSITVEVQNETTGPEWRVSAAAIATLTRLIADVAKRYKWSGRIDRSRVKGHRQYQATACPGPYLYPRLSGIAKDAERLRTGGGSPAPSKPKPKPSKPSRSKSYEWPGKKLRVDGDWGPITRRAYQRLLAGIDLYTGRIDGQIGPMTVRAEQTWLRSIGYDAGPSDGHRGPRTIKALQAKLYDDGHYRNGRYSKAVMVDGSFGKRTVKGCQRYLNSQRKYYR